MGNMDGDNRKGRPCREWLDDIKEWCQKDMHPLIKMRASPITIQMETGGKMFVGLLRAFCPWIMMMMMMMMLNHHHHDPWAENHQV